MGTSPQPQEMQKSGGEWVARSPDSLHSARSQPVLRAAKCPQSFLLLQVLPSPPTTPHCSLEALPEAPWTEGAGSQAGQPAGLPTLSQREE